MERFGKQDFTAHIRRICAKHGISVGSHSTGGRAWKKSKHVNIRPVKSSITYAVALHEIGHILGKEQSRQCLYREAAAWKWAMEHALVWTKAMEKTMVSGLQSYYKWAIRKWDRGVKNRPTIPENDHYFWNLLGHDAIRFHEVRMDLDTFRVKPLTKEERGFQ